MTYLAKWPLNSITAKSKQYTWSTCKLSTIVNRWHPVFVLIRPKSLVKMVFSAAQARHKIYLLYFKKATVEWRYLFANTVASQSSLAKYLLVTCFTIHFTSSMPSEMKSHFWLWWSVRIEMKHYVKENHFFTKISLFLIRLEYICVFDLAIIEKRVYKGD